MSCTCSPGPGEVSWRAPCSDTVASEPSKSSRTRKRSSLQGSATASSRASRFFQTLDVSMVDPGEDELTSWLGGFPVRTSALQEKVLESTESDQDSGERWQGSWARFDRNTSSWKTAQLSLTEDLELSSVTWPRSGLMLRGECYPLLNSVPRICASESGFSGTGEIFSTPCAMNASPFKGGMAPTPDGATFHHTPTTHGLDGGSNSRKAIAQRTYRTPTENDGFKWGNQTQEEREAKGQQVMLSHQTGAHGRLNPEFVEFLMGWPIGHTGLEPVAMGKYREWLRQHSPSWPQS